MLRRACCAEHVASSMLRRACCVEHDDRKGHHYYTTASQADAFIYSSDDPCGHHASLPSSKGICYRISCYPVVALSIHYIRYKRMFSSRNMLRIQHPLGTDMQRLLHTV